MRRNLHAYRHSHKGDRTLDYKVYSPEGNVLRTFTDVDEVDIIDGALCIFDNTGNLVGCFAMDHWRNLDGTETQNEPETQNAMEVKTTNEL